VAEARAAFDIARDLSRVSFDLIYARQDQTRGLARGTG
jgi:coproporphyrinogen III oxidase-like Fe-S oxidoreductase